MLQCSHHAYTSPEHIVQYLYNYLSAIFSPYGCPVSSLDELYQKEYVPKCINPQVEMIDEKFSERICLTLQGRHVCEAENEIYGMISSSNPITVP